MQRFIVALDGKLFCSAWTTLGGTHHGIRLAVISQPAMNEYVAPVYLKGYSGAVGNGKHGIHAIAGKGFS
jgi:hypothetical protein